MYTQVNKLQTPTTADKPPCCNGTPAPEKASVQACLPSNRTAAGTAVHVHYTHTGGGLPPGCSSAMCCTTAVFMVL